ncbi:MAG: pitrilysin family protein [Armatimonadota bacterium]|nr:pitrilysin family protein [Armatimonadota bacterium]MDR5697581.1 pitrilysin family protein [Armatimonadota bacterium]
MAAGPDSEYRKTTLPGGIRVVSETISDVRTVALGIWAQTGSRFEPMSQSGIAHFVEHMMFKGTRRRTARQIAEETDALGAQVNAFTDKELTCYYARVLSDHLPRIADILTDMVTDSLFSEEAIEKERQVIFEEIKMYEDSPDDLVQDLFLETIWSGDPLGRPVIGTTETISRIRRADFLEFVASEYRPQRILVAAAGDVRHEDLVEMVGTPLSRLAGEAPPRRTVAPQVSPSAAFRPKDVEQVHLCLGYPGLPAAHPDRFVQSVLDNIAGGGMASRLFQEVRERRGLVYSIGTFSTMYSDAGTFGAYAGTSPERAEEVVRITLRELLRLRDQPVLPDELQRAKDSLKGGLMLSLEGTAPRMFFLSRNELHFGRRITLDQVLAEIEAVTAERIQRLAAQILDGEPALAAIGPAGSEAIVRRALEMAAA